MFSGELITQSKQSGVLMANLLNVKLHIEQGYPSEGVMWAMEKAMGLKLTHTFKLVRTVLWGSKKGLH